MHDGDDVYVTRVFETIHVTLRGRVFFKFFSSRCVRVVSVLTEFSPHPALCEGCFSADGFFSSHCRCFRAVLTKFVSSDVVSAMDSSPHVV